MTAKPLTSLFPGMVLLALMSALMSPAVVFAEVRPAPLSATQLRMILLYRTGDFTILEHVAPPFTGRHEPVMRTTGLDESPPEDEWIASDKAQHVAFSFLWTLGTQYVAVNKGGFSERHALPLSIAASTAVGVAKEWYDLRRGPARFFSIRDLAANAAGTLLAAGIILM